ncbi:MAG: hypothetical protein ACFE9S_16200 [Candidatus Hermodarchaeota archaeon]
MTLTEFQIIEGIRKKNNWFDKALNVGYMKFRLKFKDGQARSGFIFAIDGKQYLPGTTVKELEDDVEFEIDPNADINIRFPSKDGNSWFHAIRKMIIGIYDKFPLNELKEGEIEIVSEGVICDSCKSNINTLKKLFKKISITVKQDIKKPAPDISEIFGVDAAKLLKEGDLYGAVQQLAKNPNIKINNLQYYDEKRGGFKFCHKCRAQNSSSSKFCGTCGNKLK